MQHDEAHRLAQRLAALPRPQRLSLLHRMAAQGIEPATLPIVPFGRAESLPASDAQRGLWLTWRLAPDSPAYNMTGTLMLGGTLDAGALARAVHDLGQRHEVLRTVYRVGAEGELQQVVDSAPVSLSIEDVQALPPAERAAAAQARALAHARQPFDLEQGPVWRCALLRLDDECHQLTIVVHHIAADGWSESVLVQDLAALYAAHAAGGTPDLPPLPIQFADHATWQREWGAAGEADRQLAHWNSRLAGADKATLALPLDRPRPARRDGAGARHAFSLDAETTSGLRRLAERQGCTPFMVMLGLLKLALAHLSGSHDICVGTPIARRDRAETHGLVGYLTNVVVLRTAVDGRGDVASLLAAVRATVLEAQAHADCPFDVLVSSLASERVPGLHPLFQVKCAEQHDTEGLDRFGPLTVEPVFQDELHAHFDLSLDFTVRPHEIACEWVYAVDIFDAATVAGMAELLARLARRAASAAPGQAVRELLPSRALSQAAGEPASHGVDDILVRWERSVAADAMAPAVQCGDVMLTRGQLDTLAQALAGELQARGVGTEVRVGVHAPRSIEFVLGCLAVLKAGGACVPLDPALPAARLAALMQDSGAALLLSAAPTRFSPGVPMLPIDATARDAVPAGVPAATWHPRQTAYLIYTSGSTGRPKGVAVDRGNLAHYVDGVLERMNLPDTASTMAMVSTVAADLGHTVLFGALGAGRLLHLMPAELAFDPDGFAAYMRRHRIDVLKIVPSHLQALLSAGVPADVLPRDLLVLGGEATSWPLLEHIASLRPSLRVLNHYGPTEATVGVLTQAAATALRRAGTLPLGHPLRAAAVYVLDVDLEPVARGIEGELYLGGAGISRGYMARSGQTSERFIASPFGTGERLYRSGDRVRMLDDGSLEFLGRLDDQVKIRGYRIELQEVAQALRGCDGVRDAEVIAREGADGRLQLLGYVLPIGNAKPDGTALRGSLSHALPDHMVPAAVAVLEAWPLTANGKIDRKALPDPAPASEPAHEAPRDQTEQSLAEVWADVLGLERVGRGDNFFQLGGDSILSLKVVARARKRGLALTPRQLFESRDLATLAQTLRAAVPSASTALEPIPVLDAERRRRPLPTSHAQARQWFLWQLDPQSSAYHIGGALRLRGALDEAALRGSFEWLVARHEALRTVFREDDQGQVEQLVREEVAGWVIPVIDLRERPAHGREEQAFDEARAVIEMPFDLRTGPLWRVVLLHLADDERLLVVAMHHIVSDGWSMQIIVDEFVAAYRARRSGQAAVPAPPPIQYVDHAVWHRQWLQSGEQQRQLHYWIGRLGREHPVLQLATDHPRRADGRLHLASHAIALPASLSTALLQRAQAEGATPFMLLLAAWQAVLHRYTGQQDIRIGVPVANRHRPETIGVVGLFVNTQVLRAMVDPCMSLQSLLVQVREAVLGAQDHADLPFEQLVEALQPERRLGVSPLFQVMHNHQREDDRALLQLPGLSVEPCSLDEQAAQFDLTLHTTERPGGAVEVVMAYARELFEPESIAQLAGHYMTVLRALVERPQQPVGAVGLLDADEARRLHAWGINEKRFAADVPVHRLIARQARRTPDAVAVVCGTRTVTCAALDARANRLAHRLIALGVGPEVRVALVVERSIEMLIGLLGVLKAGGAYVPMDPGVPAERLAFMLRDSGAVCLLTHERLLPQWPDAGLPTVAIDAARDDQPDHDPDVPVHGEQLAYAIYTSGSTGRPKSVMVRHRALTHFLHSMREAPGLDASDVLVSVTAPTFDIAALELYLPLWVGARIVLADRDTVRDGPALAALVEDSGATALQATPAGWRMLRAGGWPRQPLQRFKGLCGGEALPPDLAQDLRALGVDLWNMYGPTETTVWSAAAPLCEAVPRIAGPLAATALHVLDANLERVPPLVPGELYIGGVGLARGYQGRPALSAERFIADPFGGPGERLYRTGDLVRWRADGTLDYLGRLDHQVKIRGWRIELGEVEAQLLDQPGVGQAVVVAHDGGAGPRLVAYVTGEEGLDVERLKAQLARHLPDPMVPSQILRLGVLPLNANGKVDRRALPVPAADEAGFEAPQGDAEQALAAIWAELLGVPRIGRHDDFFALGGHSLLATRMVACVRGELGLELALRRVFERPVLHQLAQCLCAAPADTCAQEPAPIAAAAGQRLPLSYAQQRLWFLWKLDPLGSAFNVPIVFDLTGPVDESALRAAFEQLVARHAVLRTQYGEHDGQGWQRIMPAGPAPLSVADLGDASEAARTEAMDALVRAPFDLAQGPLRIALLRLGQARCRLVVVLHHIAADGWSLQLLMNEFAQAYAAAAEGRTAQLPPLPLQYADHALAQRRRLEGPPLDRMLTHWQAALAGISPLVLPADKAPPEQRNHPGGIVARRLDATLAEGVRRLAAARGATPFMVLLAAFAVVAAERSGQSRFLVGTDMANRQHRETQALVGFFVNQVALPIDCATPRALPGLLAQLRDTVVEASDHQELPFDKLVEAVRSGRRDARAPLFQVKVIHQEDAVVGIDLPGLTVEEVPQGAKDAELDLIVGFVTASDRIELTIKYDREIYEDASMDDLGGEMVAVLRGCLAQPDADLGALRACAAEARRGAEQHRAQARERRLAGLRGSLRPRMSSQA